VLGHSPKKKGGGLHANARAAPGEPGAHRAIHLFADAVKVRETRTKERPLLADQSEIKNVCAVMQRHTLEREQALNRLACEVPVLDSIPPTRSVSIETVCARQAWR
jgi:hypothetical protein